MYKINGIKVSAFKLGKHDAMMGNDCRFNFNLEYVQGFIYMALIIEGRHKMQITTTNNLLKAARDIAAKADFVGDREDWANIAEHIELGNYNNATAFYQSMDTFSRDALTDYAKACPLVKHEAEAALEIEWLF